MSCELTPEHVTPISPVALLSFRRGWIQSTLYYDLHGLTSHNLLSIYTVLRSTRFVSNLHGIQSTRSTIYSVFTLHGIQSQAKIIKRPYFVWIYTIFTLHSFRSTLYSIYTYFHLHGIHSIRFTIYIGFESTSLISISIVYFNLQLWF